MNSSNQHSFRAESKTRSADSLHSPHVTVSCAKNLTSARTPTPHRGGIWKSLSKRSGSFKRGQCSTSMEHWTPDDAAPPTPDQFWNYSTSRRDRLMVRPFYARTISKEQARAFKTLRKATLEYKRDLVMGELRQDRRLIMDYYHRQEQHSQNEHQKHLHQAAIRSQSAVDRFTMITESGGNLMSSLALRSTEKMDRLVLEEIYPHTYDTDLYSQRMLAVQPYMPDIILAHRASNGEAAQDLPDPAVSENSDVSGLFNFDVYENELKRKDSGMDPLDMLMEASSVSDKTEPVAVGKRDGDAVMQEA